MLRLSLDKAVRNVADFRKPASTSSGMFYLKNKCYSEYNCFFYHYSKTMLSQAEQFQKKERAGKAQEFTACPPPKMPKFKPFYEPILRIFECELFVKLLRVVFERYLKRSRFASEGLFQRSLFLMCMALNEQKCALFQKQEFKFLKLAENEDLFGFLNKLLLKQTNEPYLDLLWWTHQVKFRFFFNIF